MHVIENEFSVEMRFLKIIIKSDKRRKNAEYWMTIIYPKYYVCNDTECSVGTGASSGPNAVSSSDKGVLIVPKYHNNKSVTSIGRYAFRHADEITEIIIEARIVYIEERGIGDMRSLKKINIPSSVKRIGDYGVQFSNSGTTNGIVRIKFEGRSSLEYIGAEVFGFRNVVLIEFTGYKSPTCASNAFSGVYTVEIYSPTSINFCGKYMTEIHKTSNACSSSKKSRGNVILYSFLMVICS